MTKIKLTNNYFLSEITADDKSAFVEHFKEKQIYDNTLRIPYPYSKEDADEWVAWVANETKQIGHPINFAIRREDGYLIGGIGFHGYDQEEAHRAELGYWLAKPYWNQGIMTDAIKAITDFGFKEMGLARLTAHVFHFNLGSARALEKAGYECEGYLRNHYRKDGKVFDGRLYARVPDQVLTPSFRTRPDFIKHFSEIQEEDNSHYKGSDELLSIGAPFAKAFGLKRLSIHHELLKPGRRTSWPHAEENEEEFVYVVDGHPDVWVDGELHRLDPGDGVGFPCGTGITHTFINNTDKNVRLLVVGEASRKENKVYYPLHPKRNEEVRAYGALWEEVPKRPLGKHDGLPDLQRKK